MDTAWCCAKSREDDDASSTHSEHAGKSTSVQHADEHADHKANSNADHHDDGGWHAAEHQATHRVAEKGGFGLAEHVLEKVAESTSEHVLERSAEVAGEHALIKGASRGFEATGERLLEHAVESTGERLLERGAEAIGERLAVRGVSGATHMGGQVLSEALVGTNQTARVTIGPGMGAASSTIARGSGEQLFRRASKTLGVCVPLAGGLLVLHMAHGDWHRMHREAKKLGCAITTMLFLIAALCDSFDVVVHVCVVIDLTLSHLDHHLLHTLEFASLYGAVGALLAMIAGELLSARVATKDKHE